MLEDCVATFKEKASGQVRKKLGLALAVCLMPWVAWDSCAPCLVVRLVMSSSSNGHWV